MGVDKDGVLAERVLAYVEGRRVQGRTEGAP